MPIPKPTPMHQGLAAYITQQTGYIPDVDSVSLAVRYGKEYAKSDENRKRRADARAARGVTMTAEERARKRKVDKAARLAEQARALLAEAGVDLATEVAAPEPVEEPVAEVIPFEKPKKKSKKAKDKKRAALALVRPSDDMPVEERFEPEHDPEDDVEQPEPEGSDEFMSLADADPADDFEGVDLGDEEDDDDEPVNGPPARFLLADDGDDDDDDDDF